MRDHLKREARREIAARAAPLADQLGRRHGRITIRDTASRWGSCSAKGDLSFSWRLIMAPERVLQYVVAHEVAHLRQMNHSPRFYRWMDHFLPDWRERDARLKRHPGRHLWQL